MPSGKGLIAGIYFDGTYSYVGTGASSECPNQDVIPARLALKGSGSPGAYMECTGEITSSTNASYVEKGANLKWVPVSTANLSSVVGAVVVQGSYFAYNIGRVNLTSTARKLYQQVSKVHIDKGTTGMWYVQQDGTSVKTDTGFEVLACNY
jgi:hypothetical protein